MAAATSAGTLVEVLDAAGELFTLDAQVLLAEAWRTRELTALRREFGKRRNVPGLTIRKGTERAFRYYSRSPERIRDRLSGHAKGWNGQIVLTAGPGLGHEWLRAIVVHEAVHIAAPGQAHGPAWRSSYLRAVGELYPDVALPRNEGAGWKLDEMIAAAILGAHPR